MDDPFSVLKKNLESIFHLVPMRNGKYAYREIQQLKKAIEDYQAKKIHFVALVKVLRLAVPRLDKLRIDFETLKKPIDNLAKIHQMPPIDWIKFLSHPKISLRFLFGSLHHDQKNVELIPWLNTIAGEFFKQLSPKEQTTLLIEHVEDLGFSKKLSDHLKKDPEFLLRLILKSKNNFVKIARTRLILYLTDEQLAKSIINYLPNFIEEHPNPLVQVERLIEKLNGILSNGRSVSTLLRNIEAKTLLDSSEFFYIYQIEEYKNHRPPLGERENLKPLL